MPFQKGHPCYGGVKFTKGMTPWNKGKNPFPNCQKCGKNVRNRISKLCRACWCKSKPMPPQLGTKLSIKIREKLSLSHLGQKAWNKGMGKGRQYFYYPSKFSNFLFREEIKKRDNYICQGCGVTEEEHIIVFGYSLSLHHIDYVKTNIIETNLITVCHACNARANHNKEHWIKFYRNKINFKENIVS